MNTEVIRADHPVVLDHALDVLSNGGLVAFPTDTVYGLAVNLFDAQGIERLNTVKGRVSERAIAAMIAGRDDLLQVVSSIDPTAALFARNFWPGALTLLLPAVSRLSALVAPKGLVGIRIPDMPFSLALLRCTGPLAVTSANRYGQPLPLTAQDVLAQLDGLVHLVIDGGAVSGGVPSTIVDCTTSEPKVLREGPVSLAQLNEVRRQDRSIINPTLNLPSSVF